MGGGKDGVREAGRHVLSTMKKRQCARGVSKMMIFTMVPSKPMKGSVVLKKFATPVHFAPLRIIDFNRPAIRDHSRSARKPKRGTRKLGRCKNSDL